MNRIETWIRDIHSDEENPLFLPINDIGSVQFVNRTLDENEKDYLEGGISFVYESEEILAKDMETTDILFTWQSLIAPLLFPNEREYSVELLDSLYDIRIEKREDRYVFHRKKTYEDSEWLSPAIPIKEYNELVRVGFIEFGEYLVEHQFSFSGESSYSSFMEDYTKIKSK